MTADAPRVLEIGEFSLFKRAWPARTTFVFTGSDPASVRGVERTPLPLARIPALLRHVRDGAFDLVACHAPSKPLWDRRLGLPRAIAALLRRFARPRTLGHRLLHRRPPCAFAVLDYHDESALTPSALPLLDACDAYFKRELPLDAARAFVGAAARWRAPADVEADPAFRRNLAKLAPISLAVSDDLAREALQAGARKDTDLFFAGTLAHSPLRARGMEELAALASQGVAVDLAPGGLARGEYLARMARARLAWSPPGLGWECFRHYESALCGTVPVLAAPPIRRHRPLEDGVHAFVHDVRAGALAATVLRALADPGSLARMSAAARAHALAHHTHARACEHVAEATLRAASRRP